MNVATEYLSQLTFFGIIQLFRSSMTMLCKTFGWAVPQNTLELNREITTNAPHCEDLAGSSLGALHDANRLDEIVYRIALREFDRLCTVMLKQASLSTSA